MPSLDEAVLDTPLMRQHRQIKSAHPDAVVFFRLGDFYEMFGEDALAAAPILGLTLTSRNDVPMCGVPFHNASRHIARLLKAGRKVAVADQMEEASAAKKLVRREITRVITPGTVVEEELLSPKDSNFLAAACHDTVGWGLAWLEVSTGEFFATEAFNDDGRLLRACLAGINPSEIAASPSSAAALSLKDFVSEGLCLTLQETALAPPTPEWAEDSLWINRPLARRAALECLAYAVQSKLSFKEAPKPVFRSPASEMLLDAAAIRTLEIVASSSGDRRRGLLGILDRCESAMGSRLLKSRLLRPSTDLEEIKRRQGCVEVLFQGAAARGQILAWLKNCPDLSRLLSRLEGPWAAPRDLGGLRDSLLHLPELVSILGGLSESGGGLAAIAKTIKTSAQNLRPCAEKLGQALAEGLPPRVSDGGVIRPGFSKDLDELRSLKSDSRAHLARLEAAAREETGLTALRAGFNGVFGYYFEVPKSQADKVPARYARRQTLTHAERYVTAELKELESKIFGAEDKTVRLEKRLFDGLKEEVSLFRRDIRSVSEAAAELDFFAALAEKASLDDWVKPEMDSGFDLDISEGRHPVVSDSIAAGTFIPNSLSLDGDERQIMVLTGPNMAGKSTYLRQNALIVLMAQIGSFVPARSARIGLVDKILTRVGSSDALSEGASTFMVEMRETAYILKSATPRSLVILDEVGRGTSTFDGIAIAWAVLEHLNVRGGASPAESPRRRGPRTLFATHYFELTELEKALPGIFNANVSAREWTTPEGKTELVFLHKVSSGPADRSYGIHVAALAGLPPALLSSAQEMLERLESRANLPAPTPGTDARGQIQMNFSAPPALEFLRLIDPDRMTPLEALAALSELKKKLV